MLPHLEDLSLTDNHFTGLLPPSISNCSNLESLQVRSNKFSGKVAINFGNMKNLWLVILSYNQLGSRDHDEVKFIASMTNCSNLETLALESNQFRGALPNTIGNFSTKFSTLLLGQNFFHGNIPAGISKLFSLTWLSMYLNEFSGEIPSDIGNLQNLQRLELLNVSFSGKIPNSIGNLSSLSELDLGFNNLEGNIPASLGNCHRLSYLSLRANNFSGSIPKELFRLSLLSVTLRLDQNHLSGSLPQEIGNLGSLSELGVARNNLSGDIPSSLGRCTSLVNLYMQENSFQGSILLSLSSLRGLVNLDLSQNNLSGPIPSFFENFLMTKLNFSFNNFEGEVPMTGLVFTNSTSISVLGNSRLCGGIPELQLCRCAAKESKRRKKRSTALTIVISTVCSLLGVFLLLVFAFFLWQNKKRRQSPEEMRSKDLIMQVSYQKLLKATEGFSSANLIGVGSFGSIFKGILDENGQQTLVAVKVLNLQRRGASKSFMVECEALRNIRLRNLIKIITACSTVDYKGNDFKALVYEFMPNGSLENWLHPSFEHERQNESCRLSLFQRLNIAIDVGNALIYLHHECKTQILHCDLKPSNILLDADMVAHVGDFGLARVLPELPNANQSSSIGLKRTFGYVAPAYGLGNEASTSRDVYSYGILLLEMTTGKRATDSMFQEGDNLHNYARRVLPDRVIEIVEPFLLGNDEEYHITQEPNAAKINNKIHRTEMEECLISLIRIGVACSMESPQERMNIVEAVSQLLTIRDIF